MVLDRSTSAVIYKYLSHHNADSVFCGKARTTTLLSKGGCEQLVCVVVAFVPANRADCPCDPLSGSSESRMLTSSVIEIIL